MFGALRDAAPDVWGRRVIERRSGKSDLGEMNYLMFSPDDRAGALGFGLNQEPPAPLRKFNQTMDLVRLQELADATIADEDLLEGAEGLVQGKHGVSTHRAKPLVQLAASPHACCH